MESTKNRQSRTPRKREDLWQGWSAAARITMKGGDKMGAAAAAAIRFQWE